MGSPAQPAVTLLDVAGLSAGYGRVQVLHGVDVTVAGNEIVTLVGSNGAGKTTLLRSISGLLTPTAGRIRFAGQDITGQPVESVVRRGLAQVPEGRRLFAGLSVRDNLRLGGWATHSADLDRVLSLFPPLTQRLDQIAGTLSGGEQQMCAIARGLMSNPKLIMIDELSLGLAPLVVDQIVARLPGIAAAGTAVLLVEQDVHTALSVSTRGYVLETGVIALSGASRQLRADPRPAGLPRRTVILGDTGAVHPINLVLDRRPVGDRDRFGVQHPTRSLGAVRPIIGKRRIMLRSRKDLHKQRGLTAHQGDQLAPGPVGSCAPPAQSSTEPVMYPLVARATIASATSSG